MTRLIVRALTALGWGPQACSSAALGSASAAAISAPGGCNCHQRCAHSYTARLGGAWLMSHHCFYLQIRNRPTDMENKLMVTRGKEERKELRVWDQQVHTAIYKTGKPQEPIV